MKRRQHSGAAAAAGCFQLLLAKVLLMLFFFTMHNAHMCTGDKASVCRHVTWRMTWQTAASMQPIQVLTAWICAAARCAAGPHATFFTGNARVSGAAF